MKEGANGDGKEKKAEKGKEGKMERVAYAH